VMGSVGRFDANRKRQPAAELGLQYRSDVLFNPKPMFGAMVTFDGAFNAYGGVSLSIGDPVTVRPSFAPGFYAKGNGKDLGYKLEFRSGIEVACRFRNRSRLGLEFYHLSNAGLGSRNPGEESLMLTYSLPSRKLFGKF